ncbi:MAG TPA: hypothetical protein DCG54_12410 [Anaerolineae bacterium]|jgi:hypothetical protein|nr:hypothetical protein [Anaerolineae bacterium]
MKTKLNNLDNLKQGLKYALPGLLLFLGMAHHIVNFWERPAAWMFILLLVFVPLLTGMVVFWGGKLAPHLGQISKVRLILFLLVALLAGSFITWRLYRIPESYQAVSITPLLSQGQQVGLLEFKANFQVAPIGQAALESGWREENGAYFATAQSRPITISVKLPVNAPVTVLFLTSPESGAAEVSLNRHRARIDLSSLGAGQVNLRLASNYRGIPNWIFIPLLFTADIVTFGLFILFLLFLQEIGEISRMREQATSSGASFPGPRLALGVLLGLGLVLHIGNALAVPLIFGSDSVAFLQGAAHLLKYGNFDGVSRSVGPGSTLLFAPALWIFGRSAWGLKILLHLIALASIVVAYRLGWQLSKNRMVAFLSGLVAVLAPDLFFYSNYLMSDVPNLFFVLFFCSLLISTLERPSLPVMLALMLTGSFATLLRSENILLPAIAAFALAASTGWQWFRKQQPVNLKKAALQIGLTFIIAILPVLWWSDHNLKNHGFWGMSNYAGVVLYDGWVYFGDASDLPFSNPDSPALQKIRQAVAVHPIVVTDKKGYATGWEIYPALLASGYTIDQSMDLLRTAALDSIWANPQLTLRLLFIKLETGFRSGLSHNTTYFLPGEDAWQSETKSQYFDTDTQGVPWLIRIQRIVYEQPFLFSNFYPFWPLFCVLALALSSIRRPVLGWGALAVIVATRIFIPLTMSVPFWRYTLSGWFPLQVIALSWALIVISGILVLGRVDKNAQPPVS